MKKSFNTHRVHRCEICGISNSRLREDHWLCNIHYSQYLEYYFISSEENHSLDVNGYTSPSSLEDYIKDAKNSFSEIVKQINSNKDVSENEKCEDLGKFSPNIFKDTKTVDKMRKQFSTENSEINISDILVYLFAKQKSQEEIDRYEKEIENILNKL